MIPSLGRHTGFNVGRNANPNKSEKLLRFRTLYEGIIPSIPKQVEHITKATQTNHCNQKRQPQLANETVMGPPRKGIEGETVARAEKGYQTRRELEKLREI